MTADVDEVNSYEPVVDVYGARATPYGALIAAETAMNASVRPRSWLVPPIILRPENSDLECSSVPPSLLAKKTTAQAWSLSRQYGGAGN